ncbi:MAG: aldehyde dehydrogenase [Lachnospiraceae bacterium]|nr:aldehyde dehydrogenase [Lachnospiraceae bacterium]
MAKMIINGVPTDAANGAVMDIYNPATGEVIDQVPDATKEDVERAIAIANAAQVEWAALPGWKRAELLTKVVEIARGRIDEIGTLLCKETGKVIAEAIGEAAEFCDLLQEYIEAYKHLKGTLFENGIEKGMDGNLIMTVHMPVGVSACIVPFNYPILLYCHKISSTLLVGNTAIVKPSEYNPLALIKLTEIFKEAGVPDGVLQLVTGKGAPIGEWLTQSEGIKMINFTGSTATGTKVYNSGSKHLAHVSLEMGGNDAFIVFEDADIDQAVEEVVLGRITTSGQICIGSKRILVQNSIREEFAKKLTDRFSRVKQGDPIDPSSEIGCLITEEAAKKVQKQIDETVAQGAKIAIGGTHKGAFYAPTVLVDVTKDMDIAKDMEVFGPVAPIIGFEDEKEAVEIANQTNYGLGGAVFSKDYKRAIRVANRMITGSVNINASTLCRSHEMPFGGCKNSGIGREGISSSFEEVTQKKVILLRNILA